MAGQLAKPQLRGLLAGYMRKHGIICAGMCTVVVIAYKYGIAEPRKRRYAEFYKDYDAEAEFQKMAAKGLFQSTQS